VPTLRIGRHSLTAQGKAHLLRAEKGTERQQKAHEKQRYSPGNVCQGEAGIEDRSLKYHRREERATEVPEIKVYALASTPIEDRGKRP
jgi:hypothetical protein